MRKQKEYRVSKCKHLDDTLIGVTTYERFEYFGSTMVSLLINTPSLKWVVVHDDCSTGKQKRDLLSLMEAVSPCPKIIVKTNTQNNGSFQNTRLLIQRIMGMTHASYVVVCQDDIGFTVDWLPRADDIIEQIRTETHDEIGILSLVNFIQKTDKPYFKVAAGNPGGQCWVVGREAWGDYLTDNTLCDYKVPKNYAGRHLSDYKICHWMKFLGKREWPIYCVGQSLVHHTGAKSTISKNSMEKYVGY